MIFYRFVWFFLNSIRFLFFRMRVFGQENVPKEGGFILVANHASYLDPMLAGLGLWRRINFIAREELFHKPVLGQYLKAIGSYPIKRNKADTQAIKRALWCVKQGNGVLIFPEGTRIKTGKTRRVYPGIGLIISKARMPVVPLYIEGSDNVLPPGAKWLKYRNINLYIGKPIAIDYSQSYHDIAVQTMSEVYKQPENFKATKR